MSFQELNLTKPLLNALDELGLKEPTTIQDKAFSVIMSGRDVIGIAQTGTGKTFAYLLPCLRQWTFSKERSPQILILVPTRELVTQVVEQVQKLTAYMNVNVVGAFGGVNIKNHIAAVAEKTDVIVATPGRLIDLVAQGGLKLKAVKRFVIDEVDEMLNLGFRFQLLNILDLLPPKRQNLLFSATITDDVEALIHGYFNDPIKIEAAPSGTPIENIDQMLYKVPNYNTKVNLIKLLLKTDKEMRKVLVFVSTKEKADTIYALLEKEFPEDVAVIHGNKNQNTRFNMVKQFQEGRCRLLIATDIISRGIDVSEVTHVINFDTPEIPEDYIHRIGRTGRADKKGVSVLLTTEKETEFLENIQTLMNYEIPVKELPEELEISEILREEEMPKVSMKNIQLKVPKKENVGASFHEKSEKNKKVNKKIRRAEAMRLKYGKPKTKGSSKKK